MDPKIIQVIGDWNHGKTNGAGTLVKRRKPMVKRRKIEENHGEIQSNQTICGQNWFSYGNDFTMVS